MPPVILLLYNVGHIGTLQLLYNQQLDLLIFLSKMSDDQLPIDQEYSRVDMIDGKMVQVMFRTTLQSKYGNLYVISSFPHLAACIV